MTDPYTQILSAITAPTAATQFMNSDHVTAWCNERRKEREIEEQQLNEGEN